MDDVDRLDDMDELKASVPILLLLAIRRMD